MSYITKELHSLIKSMTPSEKKRFTVQYNDPNKPVRNSMVLFDKLRKLKNYDEDALIKYLHKIGRNKLAENLPKEINVLFKLLIKLLNHSGKVELIEDKLRNDFKDVKFLQERGCIVKSYRMLKKLKKNAEVYDQKKMLLEIYQFERETRRLNKEYRYLDAIEEIYKKEKALKKAIDLEIDLRHIYEQIFYLVQKFGMLKKGSDNKLLAKMEAALNKIDRKECNCFGTQLLYFNSMELLYLLKSDTDTAFKYMEELYHLYEKHAAIRDNTGVKYIKFLTNYLNYLIRRNVSTDDFSAIITKMRDIKLNTAKEEMLRFSRITYTEFSYYLHKGDFKKLESTIPILLEGLNKYGAKIDLARKIIIWYNIMIYYFIKQDFNTVDTWMRKMEHEGDKSKRLDLLNNSRLLELVVNYEFSKIQKTDNAVYLKYLIRKIKKSFKDADNSNELVNLVVKMMNAHCDKAHLTKKDFEAALQKFRKIDRTKNMHLPYDEIEIWLTSKGRKQSMLKTAEQILQKK